MSGLSENPEDVSGIMTSASGILTSSRDTLRLSSGDNCSGDSSDQHPSDIFHLVLLIILTSFCLVSNSLVIAVIVKEPKLQSPLNYFILNLAVSDLIHGLSFAVYNISHVDFAQTGLGVWRVCCFLVIVITTAQMASSFNLVGITGVRYIMVKEPLRCHSIITRLRMRIGVCTVWITSLVLSLALYARPQPSVYCGVCRTELFWEVHNILLMIGFTVIVPLILMAVLYCKLHSAYTEHTKKMSRYITKKEDDKHRKSKSLSRVALLLVFYFAISYLPFTIYVLTYMFCDCYISPYIRISTRMAYFSNTTVNFFVYMYRYPDFRLALLKKLGRSRRPSSTSSRRCLRDGEIQAGALSDEPITSSFSSLHLITMETFSYHSDQKSDAAIELHRGGEHSNNAFCLEEVFETERS